MALSCFWHQEIGWHRRLLVRLSVAVISTLVFKRCLQPSLSNKNDVGLRRKSTCRSFLDPSDLHHYSPLDEIVRGIQPNDMTVNRTSRHFDPNLFVVDVISTGSQLRPDYLQGQLKSWASHPSVRHFWGVSELDDRDPNCNATVGKTKDHFKKCKRELPKPTDSVVMKYFQAEY